jgi:type IV pilus assembly protein PilY1
VNKDTRFTTADNVTITVAGVDVSVPVSGIQSTVGIIKTPAVISAGEVEYKFAGGSTGGIMNVPEKGASGGGRQSWRQLR